MKAKIFWDCMCEELNFRFFTGVACEGFKSIYNAMDSNMMHYIPSVSESTALGIATGVALTGNKSCVLMRKDRKGYLDNWLEFNYELEIPVLIILRNNEEIVSGNYDFLKVLRKTVTLIYKNNKPYILELKNGVII